MDVSGQKIWRDDDDAAGLRPASVTVYLVRDGKRIAETQATAAGGWRYSFTDLPDIDVATGKAYTYAVSEKMVAGYYGYASGYDLINVLLPTEDLIVDQTQALRELSEEELMALIRIYDYEQALYGALLATGLEIPAYPFVATALGMAALLAWAFMGRRRRGSRR